MTMLASTAGDAAYWGLAIFLVAIGIASAFMLFRLAQTFERLSSFIKGTERDLLPVIVKTGATVDRVNYQLDKADTVTDSAVSMADNADTAVRAISTAISTPVEKVTGFASGITHGFSQFRKSKSFGEAASAGREAARQSEADLRDDLRNAGRTPMETERPKAQPRPEAQPKPDQWPRPESVAKPAPAPVPPDEPTPVTATSPAPAPATAPESAPAPAPESAPAPAPESAPAPPDKPTAA